MDLETTAKALKELGHPTRLNIFKTLVKAGRSGLPVGHLQKALSVPNSTLSHHIAKLVLVGLVKQERQGRVLYCIPQYEILNKIIDFLGDECCVNESDSSE